MTHVDEGALVVGVDGSPDSDRAVDWAVALAAQVKVPVHLIHASELPVVTRELGEHLLGDAAGRAARHPEVAVTTAVVAAPPVEALLHPPAPNPLAVVVGARGHARLAGLFIGSVSQHLAAHARCPVVVVREAVDPASQTVVLGVDDSGSCRRAAEFAFTVAGATGSALRAVRAWHDAALDRSGVVLSLRDDLDERLRSEEQHLIDETLAAGWQRHPEVSVTSEVVAAHPVRLLLDSSAHAGLVVVGAHGRGAFPGMLLGSVGSALLHHARCPLAIVH